jgi:kexin
VKAPPGLPLNTCPLPMLLLQILLLLASSTLLEASSRPARRFYDAYDYYALHHDPEHGPSPWESASALEVEYVEPVGELADYHLVRVKKWTVSSFDRRSLEGSSDPVVTSLEALRRRDNPISRSVRSLLPQTLRQRVKRAPIPSFPELTEVESSLSIRDPLFPSQWHIVNSESPQ